MKIKTPSKINLFLRIARRRADGYHEIETIFLPLGNPCDTVELNDSEDGRLAVTCSVPTLSGPGNLCHKAAEAFAKFAKVKPAWKIHVKKNIPVAAGLGGGSSDAAATLKLLQMKYPDKTTDLELLKISSKIGADVPFFLNPLPSLATGIGEKLKFLDVECEIPIVIVFPNFPVSAKWAYQNRLKSDSKSQSLQIISAMEKNDLAGISSLLRNDLAQALWEKFPFLRILGDEMLKAGALGIEVSGSGPSLFAIAKSAKSADMIASAINKRFKDSVSCFATSNGIQGNRQILREKP